MSLFEELEYDEQDDISVMCGILEESEAAKYLRVSEDYLPRSRNIGRTIEDYPPVPFIVVGGMVYYRITDIQEWIESLPSFASAAEHRAWLKAHGMNIKDDK